MFRLCTRFTVPAILALFLPGGRVRAAEKETFRSYQVTLLANLTTEVQGKTQKIKAKTILRYTYRWRGREATLVFDSVKVKLTQDGREAMDATMSRDKLVTVTGGRTTEVKRADTPPAVQKLLADSFGVPICKFVFDKTGKELKRTVVAGPGAKELIKQGQIANARFFHVPFLTDKDTWNAANEISMGNGGYARGDLTYAKSKGGKAGQSVVKVSGTLANALFKNPGSPVTVKGAKYLISGEQTYDQRRQAWHSGNLLLKISFQMESGGKLLGTASGTTRVKLEVLPAK